MDKGTNLFIKLTCVIISFCSLLAISPKIEDLGECFIKNQYSRCNNIGLRWLYKLRNK